MVLPYGITTVGDPNSNVSGLRDNQAWVRAYQRLSARGDLTVRVNCVMRLPIPIQSTDEIQEWLDNLLYDPGFGNDTLHLGNSRSSFTILALIIRFPGRT